VRPGPPSRGRAALRDLLSAIFCAQLVALDVALRGPAFYRAHPRALGYLAASAALLHLVASLRLRPALRAATALALGLAVTAQGAFFRYFHAPFDDQAALAARLAWVDVRPVVVHAMPVLAAAVLAIAALELAWLSWWPPARPHRRLAAAAFALGVLAGGPLRDATTEVRTTSAAASLVSAGRARPPAGAHAVLPPLASRRARVPNVLFILTESVRAVDWCGDTHEPCPLAPEVSALLPTRFPLLEMRAAASYTAISLSVLLTGLPQVGSREAVRAAPDLFDLVRATRDDGRPVSVHYWSAHKSNFFERADPASAVDSYLTAETMLGHTIEDVEEAVAGGLDRRLADECRARIPTLAPPYVVIAHFSGTHAPYFFDEAQAPFRPFGRVVTWSGLEDLHRAYLDSIVEQDRSIAACIRAFIDAQQGAPHLVVLTSDHGESFGERSAIHHGQNLYDEQIHVPAFIHAGGGALAPEEERALASARREPVTHFDVLPTILDALGIYDHFALAGARAAMVGRSLLRPLLTSPPALPITNCSEMWQCPLNAWGVLAGNRKLTAQAWDGAWRCLTLEGGEKEVDLGRCADLVAASRRFFPLRPNGEPNE
jgi:Sulfatase